LALANIRLAASGLFPSAAIMPQPTSLRTLLTTASLEQM
jgi:hypothetical protein